MTDLTNHGRLGPLPDSISHKVMVVPGIILWACRASNGQPVGGRIPTTLWTAGTAMQGDNMTTAKDILENEEKVSNFTDGAVGI